MKGAAGAQRILHGMKEVNIKVVSTRMIKQGRALYMLNDKDCDNLKEGGGPFIYTRDTFLEAVKNASNVAVIEALGELLDNTGIVAAMLYKNGTAASIKAFEEKYLLSSPSTTEIYDIIKAERQDRKNDTKMLLEKMDEILASKRSDNAAVVKEEGVKEEGGFFRWLWGETKKVVEA